MANTFRDFIIECELYPHSRENFEFMKECSEIELSEKFIYDQAFLAENKEAFNESNIVFEENYFQESVDSETIEVLTEKFNIKSKGLVGKMVRKILKIFSTFAKFLSKIGNKFDPITTKGQEVRTKLAALTIDEENFNAIKDAVEKIHSNEAYAFPIKVNQPYRKSITLKYVGGNEAEVNKLRDALAVALSDNIVIAEALLDNSGDNIDIGRACIMDPDDLYEAGMVLYAGKEGAILNVAKNLANSFAQTKKNGLKIHVNTKSINDAAARLQSLSDNINDMISQITSNLEGGVVAANSAISIAKDVVNKVKDNKDSKEQSKANDESKSAENTAGTETKKSGVLTGIAEVLNNLDANMPKASELTKAINDAVGMLTGAIGMTTKVYTQLNAYRTAVINTLDKYLNDPK